MALMVMIICGGTKDDQLSGGEGDDRIYSWIGNNTLDGGNGRDVYIITHQICSPY